MAAYENFFNAVGLKDWCSAGGDGGGGMTSMADLIAQTDGTTTQGPSL